MANPAPTLPFERRRSSEASRGTCLKSSPCKTIRSLEAADSALAELADLEATEQEIDAACTQELSLVRARHAAGLQLVIDGRPVKIADRKTELQLALQEFAEKYGEQVFDEGAKSKKLTHGEFGFRLSPAKLEPIEGGAPKSFGEKLDAIVHGLQRALGKFKTLFAAGDDKFLKVQIVLDRQALLSAAKRKELTAAELRKVGLQLGGGEDVFFAKPKSREVKSTSAVAPA